MSKRKRTLIGIVVIELLLAGLWLYLTGLAQSPEAARRIGETMGMVMGVILGLSPLLYLMARRNDLKDAQQQSNEG